jgi:hypothetical protein
MVLAITVVWKLPELVRAYQRGRFLNRLLDRAGTLGRIGRVELHGENGVTIVGRDRTVASTDPGAARLGERREGHHDR